MKCLEAVCLVDEEARPRIFEDILNFIFIGATLSEGGVWLVVRGEVDISFVLVNFGAEPFIFNKKGSQGLHDVLIQFLPMLLQG